MPERIFLKKKKILKKNQQRNIFQHAKQRVNMADTALVKVNNLNFQRKIVNVFLPINFYICFGCSKNRLIETVRLSAHNICFG